MDGPIKRRRYAAVRKAPALPPANRRFSQSAKAIRPNILPGVITFTSGLAPPPPPPDEPDFLLLDSVKDAEIGIEIPLPAPAAYGDFIQLMIAGDLVDTPVPLDEFITANSPVTMTLSAAARSGQPDGRVTINYKALYVSGGDQTEEGPAGQFYTTDFEKPGQPLLGALKFSDEVLDNGVTPAAMQIDEDGNEYLEALVPSYDGGAGGDIIKGLLGIAEENIDFLPDGDNGFRVRFLRSFIEANEDANNDGEPDGRLTFSYVVQQRSGIRSDNAVAVELDVLLLGAFNPPTPRVPAYDSDTGAKLIDVADARIDGGLIVEISGDPGYKAGDEIWVLWGDTEEIGPTPVTDPAANPVATVGVPFKAIFDSWQAVTSGADQEQALDVSYRVTRGKITAGLPLAPASVRVNVHEAGGEDPKPETPENENLGKPKLISSSGQENAILPEDAEKAATLTVPFKLIDPADALAFKPGDSVSATYDGEPLGPIAITTDPTEDLVIPISAEIIKNGMSGLKVVAFAVSRPLAAGGANVSDSPKVEVIVHGSDELPGGGILEAGTVPEGVGTDASKPDRVKIGRTEGRDGTDFVIPPYKNQDTADTISLEMKIFRAFYGTPGHPADHPPVDDRDILIENQHPISTSGETRIHLTEEQLMRYDLPTEALHAHMTYTVVGANTVDRPVKSAVLLIDVDPRGD